MEQETKIHQFPGQPAAANSTVDHPQEPAAQPSLSPERLQALHQEIEKMLGDREVQRIVEVAVVAQQLYSWACSMAAGISRYSPEARHAVMQVVEACLFDAAGRAKRFDTSEMHRRIVSLLPWIRKKIDAHARQQLEKGKLIEDLSKQIYESFGQKAPNPPETGPTGPTPV